MLKLAMIANALSCAVFGGIFLFKTSETSAFIGTPPVWLIGILGAGLIINAGLLLATAVASSPPRNHILFFVVGDVAWVLATIVLLISGLWITSANAIAWSMGVAAFVGICGWMQWRLAPS